MNIAVFASGGGSNFQQIIDHVANGDLAVNISLLVGNNSKAGCFQKAIENSIPTHHTSPSHYDNPVDYVYDLLDKLEENNIDLIVLAGYMKMLPVELIIKYSQRIVNIHPALLPAFGGQGMYGMNVHRAVKSYGARVSGVTIHLVDEEYDHGLVIHQEAVPVYDTDSPEEIAARVLKCEHAMYWRVIKAISDKTITIVNGEVHGTLHK